MGIEGIPGTVEVRPAHRFELAALERYLGAHLADATGPLDVRQFEGGQSNPTYYLQTAGRAFVLRRKPPGPLLPSAHLVEREHRILSALVESGVPVPRTRLLCEDPSVIGTAFYIMDYVPGRVLRDPRLPDLPPSERATLYDHMSAILARLHGIDWSALGLADFGRPGSYFARQIHRWTEQYRRSETDPIPAMERLIAWLPAHIPDDDQTTIVHGDYRLANMIVHPTAPRIVAVLDWELSTLGHPLADLAYNCLPYHLGAEVLEGFVGVDLAALGLPGEEAYVAAYCRRTGRAGIPGWPFYVAFAMFRLAAIAQGIMGRAAAGTAADPRARERGALARPLAEAGWGIVDAA